MTLGWGIVATGRIAHVVGTVIAQHPGMDVVAVGSRDAARAAALASDLAARRSYGSYAQLIEDPEVDAVYVATPHAQHAGVVETALRAGRAVLCEKPLTHTLAETERLAALAEETGVFLMEAMWMRFNPLVQRLRELVVTGALGDLRSVQAAFGFAAEYDPEGRLWDPLLGGGSLLDLGVYPVDFARLLLGSPDGIDAAGSLAPTGVDAEASLLLSWRSGARALLSSSLVSQLPGTALVVGSNGFAEIGPSFHAPTRLVVQVGGLPLQEHHLQDRSSGFVGEVEEVASCVARGRSQSEVAPLAETVETMRVLDAAARLLRSRPGPS